MNPTQPQQVSEYADACLAALMDCPASAKISIGGAFGLSHYHEFRTTHDVDAWWSNDCTEEDQSAVLQTVTGALMPFGQVKQRRHGDVVSVELVKDERAVFSFQIARRSALIGESGTSPWPPVKLDSLDDLLAAKMSALVNRGAPRDFVDIHEACQEGLASVQECWDLWDRRERGRGVGSPDRSSAVEAVLLHLSRIEQSRPLSGIEDLKQRAQAETIRQWFKHEFTRR